MAGSGDACPECGHEPVRFDTSCGEIDCPACGWSRSMVEPRADTTALAVYAHPEEARQLELGVQEIHGSWVPHLVPCPRCVPPEWKTDRVARSFGKEDCRVCGGEGMVDEATAGDAYLRGVADTRSATQRIRDEIGGSLQAQLGLGVPGNGLPINTPETRARINSVVQEKMRELEAQGLVASSGLTVEPDPDDPTIIRITGGVQMRRTNEITIDFDAMGLGGIDDED